jgi:hypothetical protein
MRQPPFDPDAADEAPHDMLTPHDHEHLVTYLRLLDAEVAPSRLEGGGSHHPPHRR